MTKDIGVLFIHYLVIPGFTEMLFPCCGVEEQAALTHHSFVVFPVNGPTTSDNRMT